MFVLVDCFARLRTRYRSLSGRGTVLRYQVNGCDIEIRRFECQIRSPSSMDPEVRLFLFSATIALDENKKAKTMDDGDANCNGDDGYIKEGSYT